MVVGSLISASGFVAILFPFGNGLSEVLGGSSDSLGSGLPSDGAEGFFSWTVLGNLLCSEVLSCFACERCLSWGADVSGCCGVACGGAPLCCWPGWCRGDPVGWCFGLGSGIGAGSPRLPSSSLWVWQFKHSHSFFWNTMRKIQSFTYTFSEALILFKDKFTQFIPRLKATLDALQRERWNTNLINQSVNQSDECEGATLMEKIAISFILES